MYRLPSIIRPARQLFSPKLLTPRLAVGFSTSQQQQSAKELKFGADARLSMLKGVDALTDAVAVTLGPKVEYMYSRRVSSLNTLHQLGRQPKHLVDCQLEIDQIESTATENLTKAVSWDHVKIFSRVVIDTLDQYLTDTLVDTQSSPWSTDYCLQTCCGMLTDTYDLVHT